MATGPADIKPGKTHCTLDFKLESLTNPLLFQVITQCYGTATSSEGVDANTFLKKEKTSKAMKAYLERAREHDEFMKTQHHEFEIGKRHLANMMGESPEAYESQETIDVRSN